MAENSKAQEMYELVLSVIKRKKWDVDERPDDLELALNLEGEDLPIAMNIRIKERLEAISIFCNLPFEMTEENRMSVAAAINFVNGNLDEGNFDFNLKTGDIGFRNTALYSEGSIISDKLVDHMLDVTVQTLNRFTAGFFVLSKGMISLEQFLEAQG